MKLSALLATEGVLSAWRWKAQLESGRESLVLSETAGDITPVMAELGMNYLNIISQLASFQCWLLDRRAGSSKLRSARALAFQGNRYTVLVTVNKVAATCDKARPPDFWSLTEKMLEVGDS